MPEESIRFIVPVVDTAGAPFDLEIRAASDEDASSIAANNGFTVNGKIRRCKTLSRAARWLCVFLVVASTAIPAGLIMSPSGDWREALAMGTVFGPLFLLIILIVGFALLGIVGCTVGSPLRPRRNQLKK